MSISVRQPRGAKNLYPMVPDGPDAGATPVAVTAHPMPSRRSRASARPRLREVNGTRSSNLAPAFGLIVGVTLSVGLWALIALALWLV